MKKQKPQNSTNPNDSPVAWFATLERARLDGNHERAAHALRELRRLGVTVRFATAARKGGQHDRP